MVGVEPTGDVGSLPGRGLGGRIAFQWGRKWQFRAVVGESESAVEAAAAVVTTAVVPTGVVTALVVPRV